MRQMDQFATFFQDKVDSVRSSTESTPLYDVPYRSTPTLDELTPVTADEVDWLSTLQDIPVRSCPYVAGQRQF